MTTENISAVVHPSQLFEPEPVPLPPSEPEWRKSVRCDSMRNINRHGTGNDMLSSAATTAADYTMKFILLGDSGVGKTSLWRCYTKGIKLTDLDEKERSLHRATIGVEVLCRDVLIGQYRVKIMIWDTAGQERFSAITMNYIQGAHGIILVYDVTQPKTCEHILEWYGRARDRFERSSMHPLVLVIGNKIDLERQVKREEASTMFQQLNFFYQETSCMTSQNIQDALDYFAGACWVQCIKTATAIADGQKQQRPATPSSIPLASRPIEACVDQNRSLSSQIIEASVTATDPRVLGLMGAASYGTATTKSGKPSKRLDLGKNARRRASQELGSSLECDDYTITGEEFDKPGCDC